MSARTPEDVHHRWTRFFLAGDLDGCVSMYEPNAIMIDVGHPGQFVSGHAAIREGLNDLLAIKKEFELRFLKALESGDIAILYSRWKLAGTGRDGSAVRMKGQTSDVVRRQPDGSWLLVIDNPLGHEGIGVAAD